MNVGKKHPEVFCRLLSKLVPKDLNIGVTPIGDGQMDDLELARKACWIITRTLHDSDVRNAKEAAVKAQRAAAS